MLAKNKNRFVKKIDWVHKPKIVITMLVLLAIVFGVGLWLIQDSSGPDSENISPQSDNTTSQSADKTTSSDEKDATTSKTDSSNNSTVTPKTPDSSGQKKNVTPVIASVDPPSGQITAGQQITIRASVPGIFEDGGTCTAKLVNGTKVKTGISTGFKNVSDTICAPIPITISYPGTGSWYLTVSYSSATASGSSSSQLVKVK